MKKVVLTLCIVISALLITMLSGCNMLKVGKPDDIQYDGYVIRWNAVENADNYLLKINDGDEKVITEPSFAYNAEEKEFSVSVTAVSSDKIVNKNVAKAYFKPLPAINDFQLLEDGTVSWEPVPGATGYIVEINDTELESPTGNNVYSAFEPGANIIRVRPVVTGNNSYYSTYGASANLTKLAMPSEVVYQEGYIKWTGSENASDYLVSVNGQETYTSNTKLQYDSEGKNFTVSVKAIGNYVSTYDSMVTQLKSFVYLPCVRNISIENGIAVWDTIAGADSYQVRVGNNTYNVTENMFGNLPVGSTQSLSVMPVSNKAECFSEWSEKIDVCLLSTPVLKWEAGVEMDGAAMESVFWNAVNGASGYEYRILHNGNIAEQGVLSLDMACIEYAYLQIGTYSVQVKAYSDQNGINDSAYSKAITVNRLAPPTKMPDGEFIISDPCDITKGFQVNYVPVVNAAGYQLYKNGVALEGYTTTKSYINVNQVVDEDNTAEKQFSYSIRSLGNMKTQNGTIVVNLSSLTEYNLSFKISVLQMPVDCYMSGYSLLWNAVENAPAYSVNISGTRYSPKINECNLSILKSGSYSAAVCSMGNGADILPSMPTAPISIVRFKAPTDLYVTTGTDEGTLKFKNNNPVEGTYQNYLIVVGGISKESNTADGTTNINNLISTGSTKISVQITANQYCREDSALTYYMSSPMSDTLNVMRLSQISRSSIRFTKSQLLWSPPDNINTSVVAVSYRLTNGVDGVDYSGRISGASMDISYLTCNQNEDADYSFCIRAIGDGKKYVNSLPSDTVKITKLASPCVKINTSLSGYEWVGSDRASGYTVQVDGVKVKSNVSVYNKIYTYIPNFTQVSSYTVEICANGDNLTTLDSEPVIFRQSTKQLAMPEFSYRYTDTEYNPDGKIVVEITYYPDYANGYIYSISGATSTKEETGSTTYSRGVSTAGKYSIAVKALGGKFDGRDLGNSIFYVDSKTCGGESSFITILSKVSQSSLSITAAGKVYWDTAIDSAIGYEYCYSWDGSLYFSEWMKTDISSMYFMTGIADHSSLTVRVRAIGDGKTIISGMYTEKTFSV